MQIEELKVKISAEMASFRGGIKAAKDELNNLSKSAEGAEKKINSALGDIPDPDPMKIGGSLEDAITKLQNLGKEAQKVFSEDFTEIDIQDSINQIKRFENTIEELSEKRDSLIEAVSQGFVNDDFVNNRELYDSLIKQITDFEAGIISSTDAMNGLKATLYMEDTENGIVRTSKALEELKRKAYETEQELKVAEQELKQMSMGHTDFSTDSGMDEQMTKVSNLKSALLSYQVQIREAQAEIEQSDMAPDASKWDQVANAIKRCAQVAGMLKTALANCAKGFVKMYQYADKTVSAMNPLPKIANRVGKSISTLGSKIKTAFIYTAVNQFFNSIRQKATEWISTNEQMKSSLSTLGGAWKSAFAPIVQAAIPYIVTLINYLTRLASVFASVVSLLTGKAVGGFKATAQGMENAAKAEDKLGGAAGGANDEMKKQLASFDELNVLQDNSSGGGGGGGGGLEDVASDLQDLSELNFKSWGEAFSALLDKIIEKLPILDSMLQKVAEGINWFSENLLEMFTYDGVLEKVQYIGQELGNIFNRFADAIDWTQLGKALGAGTDLLLQFYTSFMYAVDWKKLGSHFSEGINGIVSMIDWDNFGKALVAHFNAVIGIVAGFVKDLDWTEVGIAFAGTMRGAFTNIDLVGAAEGIKYALTGVFHSVVTFCQQFNWYEVGTATYNKIKEVFTSLDITSIIAGLFKLTGSLIAAVVSFAAGLGKNVIDAITNYFSGKIEACGGDIIKGLLKGIWDAIKGIGSWIVNNIGKPFIDGFKSVFKIGSPSKVMEEMGGYIVQGLYNGITKAWSTITTFFTQKLNEIKIACEKKFAEIKASAETHWTAIKTTVGGVMDNLRTSLGEKWNNVKTDMTTKADQIKQSVHTTFEQMKDKVIVLCMEMKTRAIPYWNEFKQVVVKVSEEIKTDVSKNWTQLKEELNTLSNAIKTTLSNAWNTIKNDIDVNMKAIQKIATVVWETIKTSVTNTVNAIKTNVSNVWNGLKNTVNSITDEIKSHVNGGFEGIQNKCVGAFTSIASAAKSKLSGITGYFDDMVDGISNTFSKLNNKFDNLKTKVSNYASTGFNKVTSTVNSFIGGRSAAVPAMASGGVVNSPTMALVGEYAGARSNPEIVTPQNLMRATMADANEDLIDTLIQLNRQLISAINNIDTSVVIGDDTIAGAVQRSNSRNKMRTGLDIF